MASIKFAGLVIGIIIVSLALKYSSACAHEGRGRKGKLLAGIASQNHATYENGIVNGFFAAAVDNNIAGRKGLMRARKLRVHESMKREQGSDEEPKISGIYSLKKSSKASATQDYHLKTQDNSKMAEQPKQKSARMGIPNSTPSDSLQYASKAFLDAADEVVNLMRKDYTGKGRPRQMPPINNHKPTD